MNEDKELVVALELRMRQLMLYCDSLKDEAVSLKNEIKQKNENILELNETIKELKNNYNDLKFAKSFAHKETEEGENAKKRLKKLVRDVDKCISILRS